MALIPTRFKCDPWDLRLPKLVDRLGIDPIDIPPFVKQYPVLSYTPRVKEDLQYTCIGNDGRFIAYLDVKHFKPEEITVKTVDNVIIVEGKQDEKRDKFGYISRHFVRKYGLPEGYDGDKVESSLSLDGILTIKAPPPIKSIEDAKQNLIPIEHTGVPHPHPHQHSHLYPPSSYSRVQIEN